MECNTSQQRLNKCKHPDALHEMQHESHDACTKFKVSVVITCHAKFAMCRVTVMTPVRTDAYARCSVELGMALVANYDSSDASSSDSDADSVGVQGERPQVAPASAPKPKPVLPSATAAFETVAAPAFVERKVAAASDADDNPPDSDDSPRHRRNRGSKRRRAARSGEQADTGESTTNSSGAADGGRDTKHARRGPDTPAPARIKPQPPSLSLARQRAEAKRARSRELAARGRAGSKKGASAKDRAKTQRLRGQAGIGSGFRVWRSDAEMAMRQSYD